MSNQANIATERELQFLPRLAPIGLVARRLGIDTRAAGLLPCRTIRVGRQLHVYVDDLKLLFQGQDALEAAGDTRGIATKMA